MTPTIVSIIILLLTLLLFSMRPLFRPLYGFRVTHLFLFPSEARAVMMAAEAQRQRFIIAIQQFTLMRAKENRHEYELKITIPKAALETSVSDAIVIAEVAHIAARRLVERHRMVRHSRAA